MKTKLTLLLGTLALATMTYADTGSFRYVPASNGKGGVTLVPVREHSTTSIALFKSSRTNAHGVASAADSGSFRYVPASNGKGGITLVPVREQSTTSIALVKSSGAMCCGQH